MPAAKKVKVRQVPIMWTDDDEESILYPHEDALVIKASKCLLLLGQRKTSS